MIRSFPVRTLSALAFAMILPVAALAATGTDAKATTAHPAHMAHASACRGGYQQREQG